MSASRTFLALLPAALLAVACVGTGPRPGEQGDVEPAPEPVASGPGAAPHERDAAPPEPLTPHQVAEATPQPELILDAGNSSPYRHAGVDYQVLKTAAGYRQRGIASWYGKKFHGRPTATGERFDAYGATAAHRSLPLPTYVRVTNLDNRRSIIVKVNDRGPFHSERLIDLSYGAALKLGFVEQGLAPVEVVALSVQGSDDLRDVAQFGGWQKDYRFLQVASFAGEDAARALQKRLRASFSVPVRVAPDEAGGRRLFEVKLGPVSGRRALLALREKIFSLGFADAYLVPE